MDNVEAKVVSLLESNQESIKSEYADIYIPDMFPESTRLSQQRQISMLNQKNTDIALRVVLKKMDNNAITQVEELMANLNSMTGVDILNFYRKIILERKRKTLYEAARRRDLENFLDDANMIE